jgi:uncharacterized protein (TIGR00255 family)
MALNSMTGFARADGSRGPVSWHWEVRAVNGRGLDVRLRMPPGYDALEPKVREVATKRFARGSLTVGLAVRRLDGVSEVRLNEAVLEQVIAASEKVRRRIGAEPPRVEALLSLRGVLDVVEAEDSEAETEARQAQMLKDLETAFAGVAEARAAEGRRLAAVISDQLGQITACVDAVAKAPARSTEAVRQRLREQIAKIMENGAGVDEGRLAQEAALLATRADVEEELKRLNAHIAAARDLLAIKGPAGRKFDFLAQEFNREANTLCSKSNDTEITRIGLELKTVIDQMREQVQNIE